jgi:hypothetical protein
MKGRPIDQLVFEHMFSTSPARSPANFEHFVTRSLIPEVRHEVQSFYGHLQTHEAKYPGLDYTHPIHRIRLSRWQWHRRLFRAFDALGLTDAEIAGLTKWEGTKWAKDQFEKETGVKILDTAADDIPRYVEPEDRWAVVNQARSRATTEVPSLLEAPEDEDEEVEDEEEEEDEDDNDAELQTDDESSILQRMMMTSADRSSHVAQSRYTTARQTLPVPVAEDTEWEAWFKNAIESGELPYVAEQIARISQGSPQASATPLTPDDIFPPRMLAAARADLWHEVPEFLRDMIRQSLENEERRIWGSFRTGHNPDSRLQAYTQEVQWLRDSNDAHQQRRTWSGLRLPGNGSSRVNLSSPSASGPATF